MRDRDGAGEGGRIGGSKRTQSTPSRGNSLSSFLACCLLASLWPLLYGAHSSRAQNRPRHPIIVEPHKKGEVVPFAGEADKMRQAHALCK
jgi:hypothetical protein